MVITRNCPEVFRSSKVILKRICIFTQSYLIVRNNFKMLPSIGGSENWARKSSATIMLKLQSNFWSNISLLLVSLLRICLSKDRIPNILPKCGKDYWGKIVRSTHLGFFCLCLQIQLNVCLCWTVWLFLWPFGLFASFNPCATPGQPEARATSWQNFMSSKLSFSFHSSCISRCPQNCISHQ